MSQESPEQSTPAIDLYAFAKLYRVMGPSLDKEGTLQGFRIRVVAAVTTGIVAIVFWIFVATGSALFFKSVFFGPAIIFTVVSIVIGLVTVRKNDFERLASLYSKIETALWMLSISCALVLDTAALVLAFISPKVATQDAIVLHLFSGVMAAAALTFVAQSRDYTSAFLTVDERRCCSSRRFFVITAQWLALSSLVVNSIVAIARFSGLGAAGIGIVVAGVSFMLGVDGAQRKQTWSDAAAITAAVDGFALALQEVGRHGHDSNPSMTSDAPTWLWTGPAQERAG